MRIFFITSSYPVHDIKFLSSLEERGHDIEVFILRPRKLNNNERVKGVKYHINEFLAEYYTKYNIWYKVLYFISFIKTAIILQKQIKLNRPDVIHGGNVQTAGFLTAFLNFHPFLLMPYGSDILIYPDKSHIVRIITKYTINKADAITCDAKKVKNKIIELSSYKKKIVVFPWGVDLKKFNPGVKGTAIKSKLGLKNKIILLCNRAHYRVYGIEYIINAMSKIVKGNPNVRLLLMGYTPLSNNTLTSDYRKMINSLGIEEYVKIIEPVPNDQMPYYITASDIYVSASLSDGTSVSLIEAMACGLPLVVTNIESNLEWVEDGCNGLLCRTQSASDIAQKILLLLKNDKTRTIMGKRNVSIAKKRANWDKNITKLEKLYSSISLI